MPLRTIRNILVVVALGVFVLTQPGPANAQTGCSLSVDFSQCGERYWNGQDTNCILCEGVGADCGCGNPLCSGLEMLACKDGSGGFSGGDCATEYCLVG
jgi:hypothetical protein